MGVDREAEGEVREVSDLDSVPVRDNRERNEYWGRLYHARLIATGSKEAARTYACSETLQAYGSTPFAKRGDSRP